MSAILNSVAPLFAVIFLGFFAGRAGYLGEAGIRGLGAFVFNFAIPPYVFRLMAGTDLEAITEWGFLGGYLALRRSCSRPGAGIGRLVFGMGIAEMTIQALRLGVLQRRDAGAAAAALALRRRRRRAGAADHHARRDRVQLGHGAARDRPRRRRGATRGRIVLQAAARGRRSTRSSWAPCSASSTA